MRESEEEMCLSFDGRMEMDGGRVFVGVTVVFSDLRSLDHQRQMERDTQARQRQVTAMPPLPTPLSLPKSVALSVSTACFRLPVLEER